VRPSKNSQPEVCTCVESNVFVTAVKCALYCLPVSSIRHCRGEVVHRRTSSCTSGSCVVDTRPIFGEQWRSPSGEPAKRGSLTRMLIRRLGVHTRLRLRQPFPNPTAVCSLGERRDVAPSALRRSALSFSFFLFPVLTNSSQTSQTSSTNEGPRYHPNQRPHSYCEIQGWDTVVYTNPPAGQTLPLDCLRHSNLRGT